MTEGIPKLKSVDELEREEKMEKLKSSPNGFLFEERDGKKYVVFLGTREEVGGAYEDHVVEVETEIENTEEMQEIVRDILPTPLARKIWTFLIDAYNQQEIPLIQSLPGTGKTYAFHRLEQLLHGKGSRATKEDLLCTPKTSELEILGKWVPNGQHGIGAETIRQKLSESNDWVEFTKDFEFKLASLFNEKDKLSEEEFMDKKAELDREYREKQLTILLSTFPDAAKGQWRFEEGALIRAYQSQEDPTDTGGFLLVDEIDNLPENYQNIFLQIAGEGGKLASKITTYSGSGKSIYKRGQNTFIGFAANYPEFSPGKRSISAPLADRVTWLSVTPEESKRDEKLRVETFSFRGFAEAIPSGASPEEIEEVRHLCARTLAAFHIGWKQNFRDYNKIEGVSRVEVGREQGKEFSQRTTARVERFVVDNLNNKEFFNKSTGKVDLTKLLAYAIRVQYLKYLASEESKRKVENELLLPLFFGGRKYLEKKDDTYVVKEQDALKEGPFTFVEDAGSFRPYDPKLDKGKKVLAFDEVADILVGKVFRSTEERERAIEEKRRMILDFDVVAALGALKDEEEEKEKRRASSSNTSDI